MKKVPFSIQNAIFSSFLIIEDLIDEIENLLDNDRIFLKIEKDFGRHRIVLGKIKQIKEILKELKKDLNLKEEIITDKAIIGSRCAKIWEVLNDMKGEKLKKYGDIPDWVKSVLNFKVEKILKLINEMVK
ncbi:MAG TPA: hypothetical protein PKV21_09995 [bacterium]|nr:hypothetical protein [bacterium]